MRCLIIDNNTPRRTGIFTIARQVDDNLYVQELRNVDDFKVLSNEYLVSRVVISTSIVERTLTDLIEVVKQNQPLAKILLITNVGDIVVPSLFLEREIDGFIYFNSTINEFEISLRYFIKFGSLRSITKEKVSYFSAMDKIYNLCKIHSSLSEKEKLMLELILKGHKVIDSAKILKISPSAASTYKKRAFKKLGIKNIIQYISILEVYRKLA
ncbi:LuxR C-terminal-related transcriptional regulator [Sphingobacterium corticis]|uniref:LuxR C-terminal-related transcriptional regulator n=1 Tax=Sphingobacterium corticis TaxID=1812823 RepID=A0ABW5NL23_9SPHI